MRDAMRGIGERERGDGEPGDGIGGWGAGVTRGTVRDLSGAVRDEGADIGRRLPASGSCLVSGCVGGYSHDTVAVLGIPVSCPPPASQGRQPVKNAKNVMSPTVEVT